MNGIKLILFIDFDGVMHGVNQPCMTHKARLEALLREFPAIGVVISSSWREIYPWPDLVGLFADDVQPRMLASTPVMRYQPPYPRYVRYQEICAYLGQLNQGAIAWLALDDDETLFPPDCSQLVLCDPHAGFDAEAEIRLRQQLEGLCKHYALDDARANRSAATYWTRP